MAERRRKKKTNVITINPLKANEYTSRQTIIKKGDKSKQLPKQPKATLSGNELIDLYINDKLKRSVVAEIKDSTPVESAVPIKRNEVKDNTEPPSSMPMKVSTSSPRQPVAKKFPTVKRYDIKPVVPAQKKELIPVARAMHREDFGSRLQTLFQPEKEAALEAIESEVYIGWRCEEYTWDCIRLGSRSRCFCNHSLCEHEAYNGKSVKVRCLALNCSCKSFAFIPERPQDIGEWWLQKRPGFDISTWRAKCKCKHTHDVHDPETKICAVRGCNCFAFRSNFLCAACDRRWEDHWTFFDTASSRKEKGLPVGEEYLPFYEMAELRNIVLNGEKQGVNKHRGRIQNAISSSRVSLRHDGGR